VLSAGCGQRRGKTQQRPRHRHCVQPLKVGSSTRQTAASTTTQLSNPSPTSPLQRAAGEIGGRRAFVSRSRVDYIPNLNRRSRIAGLRLIIGVGLTEIDGSRTVAGRSRRSTFVRDASTSRTADEGGSRSRGHAPFKERRRVPRGLRRSRPRSGRRAAAQRIVRRRAEESNRRSTRLQAGYQAGAKAGPLPAGPSDFKATRRTLASGKGKRCPEPDCGRLRRRVPGRGR